MRNLYKHWLLSCRLQG
uniref:Uncharacterized protein n=1 Tax=Anguilla anguilla TaxID=7936 RepID=A0A0E9TGQ5_ANGAN